ncbi:YfkD famly protein [Litchfieldia salsa]|uniref:YfkD-like protein n=1 Tax=Litchfieldia salsa TaxID=930152 RepID=A0A1H0WLC0_9BACI|nr:YfkD famly protein [Litchfieldia salsa]SDP91499.1 YfkD-like protein [Litchfieldia salsa]
MKFLLHCIAVIVLLFSSSITTFADKVKEEPKEEKKENQVNEKKSSDDSEKYQIPNSVMDISKENTYPNPTQDLPYLQPSELTKELIETAQVNIENPDLIKILNESSISTTPLAIGYRATIYLGQWALNYESTETNVNWEYQKINTNYYDNRGGKAPYQIHYNQEAQKQVKGGLTAKIESADEVKKMMLITAANKTKLPLSFETIIGAGTKKDQVYNIPPKRLGYLYAYAPAVNEKGKVTYGEVYLVLKGSKKSIVVKNVTHQGIGAWIPVQDHASYGFVASEVPK